MSHSITARPSSGRSATAHGQTTTTATASARTTGKTVHQHGRGRTGSAAISLVLSVVGLGVVAGPVVGTVTGAGAVSIVPVIDGQGYHVPATTGSGAVSLIPSVQAAGTVFGAPVSGSADVSIVPMVSAAGTTGSVVGSADISLVPSVSGAGTSFSSVVGTGAVSLVPAVTGAGTHYGLTVGAGAVSLIPAVAAAATVSGNPGTLIFSDSFASFQLRTRSIAGGNGTFEQSFGGGTGVWTPRHMYLLGEQDATYNNGEYAAFIDPTSPTVQATGYTPFTTSAGVLNIRCEPTPSSVSALVPNRHTNAGDTGVKLPWVGGLATTRHSFWVGNSFSAEIEAQVQKGQASFPAPLWMFTREDYFANEIDVMEYQGHRPTWSNWAVHGVSGDGLWAERNLGDLSGGWFKYGLTLNGTDLRIYINGVQIGQSTVDQSFADAHWYLIINNTMMNWDDLSGPNLSALPYPTQNPSDLKVRNLKVFSGTNTSWGGDASPALSGSTAWIAPSVNGVAPGLHLDLTNSRLYEAGSLRHLGHVTSTVGGLRKGYGALFQAIAADSGTLVVKVDTPAGSNATTAGAIISPYEYNWMIATPGLGLSFKHAGGGLTVPGFGSGAKTIVRSWGQFQTKALVQGSSVVSAGNGNIQYLGERMNLGASFYGDLPFGGTIKEIIFYPHSSALSDAQMAAIT